MIMKPPTKVQTLGISEKIMNPATLAKIKRTYSIGDTIVVSANFKALMVHVALKEPKIANKKSKIISFIFGVLQKYIHKGNINIDDKNP